MPHPTVSSLQPTCVPPTHAACRTYSTVSNAVVPPQVWIVETPDTVGVHWNTASGAAVVEAHVPESALVPDVAPVNTPPSDGITVGDAHVAVGSVVLVVELLVVLVDVLVDVVVVLLVDVVVVASVVLVVEVLDVLVVDVLVDVVLVVLVDVVELVVVVVGGTGAPTVSVKLPAPPP